MVVGGWDTARTRTLKPSKISQADSMLRNAVSTEGPAAVYNVG